MQTNPAAEQNKTLKWSESPWNQFKDALTHNINLSASLNSGTVFGFVCSL